MKFDTCLKEWEDEYLTWHETCVLYKFYCDREIKLGMEELKIINFKYFITMHLSVIMIQKLIFEIILNWKRH